MTHSIKFVAIRWFTPAAEVQLCGHATLASAAAIFKGKGQVANLPSTCINCCMQDDLPAPDEQNLYCVARSVILLHAPRRLMFSDSKKPGSKRNSLDLGITSKLLLGDQQGAPIRVMARERGCCTSTYTLCTAMQCCLVRAGELRLQGQEIQALL